MSRNALIRAQNRKNRTKSRKVIAISFFLFVRFSDLNRFSSGVQIKQWHVRVQVNKTPFFVF